jgi:hypothetical protein
MTDNKDSALLFSTPEDAKEYVKWWRITSLIANKGVKVEIVEVTVKTVASKIGKVYEKV